MDMLVDTWICEFSNNTQNTKVNKYFIGILNSWILRPTKYIKFNVQHFYLFHSILNI